MGGWTTEGITLENGGQQPSSEETILATWDTSVLYPTEPGFYTILLHVEGTMALSAKAKRYLLKSLFIILSLAAGTG